jgi:hypothetical protein
MRFEVKGLGFKTELEIEASSLRERRMGHK